MLNPSESMDYVVGDNIKTPTSNQSMMIMNSHEMQKILKNSPENFDGNVILSNKEIYQNMVKFGKEGEISYNKQSDTIKSKEFGIRNRKSNMTKTLNDKSKNGGYKSSGRLKVKKLTSADPYADLDQLDQYGS